MYAFYRHKNIRTKDSLNVQMSVQAGLTYLCSFNVCTFGAWLSAFLLERTQAWVFVIFFRHKNIRFIECSNVCSSELDILLSFQCLHLWCCVYDELLLQMNRRYCFFKNVCCMVNTSFACLMNIWEFIHELVHEWTDGWSLPTFLCSFVLVSFIYCCLVFSLTLCCRWD